MRVRCIDNKYNVLPSTSIYYTLDHKTATFSLQPGTEYIVYGIWIRGAEVLYSILDDERASYPKWFPFVFFDVEDGRLPACWRYGLLTGRMPNLSGFLLAIPEWINDQAFNEKLV